MALTPETRRSLVKLIDQIEHEAGSDPQHKPLLGSLRSAREVIDTKPADKPASDESGDDSFETAQKRHGERLRANREALAAVGTDGGER